MTLTTFAEENIINEDDNINKSLFIILFHRPNEQTNIKFKMSPYVSHLKTLVTNPNFIRYAFLIIKNPINYNLLAKELKKPKDRQSLQEDFLFIEEELLLAYIRSVNVFSSIICLN